MAEETKPTPSRHRLEKLTEDYIGERRKKRGGIIRGLLGMPAAPETSVSEMAEFNKIMAMHHKEIVAFQNKVFDSETERIKQRAVVLGKVLDSAKSMINTRATAGTAMNRERLVQSGKNLDMLYKGLDLAVKEADAMEEGTLGLTEDEIHNAHYKIQGRLRGKRYKPDEAASELMRIAKTDADREEILRRVRAPYDEADKRTGAFASQDRLRAMEGMLVEMKKGERKTLSPERLEQMGIDPEDTQSKEYAELGWEMIMHPKRAATNFSRHQTRINNTQAHLGGSMGATLAELAGAMSPGTSSGTLEEALNDLGYEIGLTEQEAALLSNADRQKEVLLGQMYDPQAPPAIVQARDTLLQDEGFKSFKDSMGFRSDRAAFIALRRQFRKDRKQRIKHDRKLLRKNSPKKTSRVSEALNALKQNVDTPTQTVAAPSSQAAQPAKPEDTIKTGGTIGGQTGK